jgi:hypothetical protein
MTVKGLERARITVGQTELCLHYLAALNHRQWALWEEFVIPLLEGESQLTADEIFAQTYPDVAALLSRNAQTAVDIVKGVVGSFAYRENLGPVCDRKAAQYRSWINYAVTKSTADLERWKLQCRTPFLDLTAKQQRSDYVEAAADLQAIAAVGGLVLPETLPPVQPHGRYKAAWLRFIHMFAHGRYATSEVPWSKTCQGCNQTWGSMTP